jgi:hypothetical protein
MMQTILANTSPKLTLLWMQWTIVSIIFISTTHNAFSVRPGPNELPRRIIVNFISYWRGYQQDRQEGSLEFHQKSMRKTASNCQKYSKMLDFYLIFKFLGYLYTLIKKVTGI